MIKKRIASIDIFRALTMLLMVFVNDLWTLHNIPEWLKHTEAREDGMGFSDVIFPLFLFIVGLSIPFALQSRFQKGENLQEVLIHIFSRGFALIVMGLFLVNYQYFRNDVSFHYRMYWKIAMVCAFFLIWNDYKTKKIFFYFPVWILQAAGVVILVALIWYFKGGSPEKPEWWMRPHWWGILGLIGWSYLLGSLIYLIAGNRIFFTSLILLFFYFLNAQEFLKIWKLHHIKLLVSASNYALVTAGIITTILYIRLKKHKQVFLFPAILFLLAAIFTLYGFQTRPLWGISKILATPSWVALSTAISLTVFSFLYLIADIFKCTRWAFLILPAGRSALTTYLLPVIVYALFYRYLKWIPYEYRDSVSGLIKSFLFALTIVLLTGILEKVKIKIKI